MRFIAVIAIGLTLYGCGDKKTTTTLTPTAILAQSTSVPTPVAQVSTNPATPIVTTSSVAAPGSAVHSITTTTTIASPMNQQDMDEQAAILESLRRFANQPIHVVQPPVTEPVFDPISATESEIEGHMASMEARRRGVTPHDPFHTREEVDTEETIDSELYPESHLWPRDRSTRRSLRTDPEHFDMSSIPTLERRIDDATNTANSIE